MRFGLVCRYILYMVYRTRYTIPYSFLIPRENADMSNEKGVTPRLKLMAYDLSNGP